MTALRLLILCLLPAPLFAADKAPAVDSIPSILEFLGTIVEAAKKLNDLQLVVILIAVLCPVTLMLHRWHKRDGITYASLVMLTLLAVLAAFQTYSIGQQLKPGTDQRLLLPYGMSREMKPFIIALTDVDTLKFGPTAKPGDQAPWAFNQHFGREALADFVETGRARARKLFPDASTEDLKAWPTVDELWQVAEQPDPAKSWTQLVSRLDIDVSSTVTKRTAKLRAALSKWPIAHLQITDAGSGKVLQDRYYPDQSEISLTAGDGTAYRLKIETIFNGDRDLGEAEACQLSLTKVDK